MFNAALAAILVAALVLWTGVLLSRPKKPKQRLRTLIQANSVEEATASVEQTIRMENSITQREQSANWLKRKERQLKQSNTGITLPIYFSVLIAACAGVFLFMYTIMRSASIALALATVGIFVPEALVKARVRQNIERFNSDLAKALRRMASILRSGGTLKDALMDTACSRSMPPIIQIELTKVIADIEYGKKFEDALYALYERTGSQDVMQLAVAVEVQGRGGGDMAKTFDSIAQNITNRELMQSDVKATLAQNRVSATALSVMPFFMVFLFRFISPGYFDPLLGTTTGKLVFLICFLWIGLGAVVIRRMSNLKL